VASDNQDIGGISPMTTVPAHVGALLRDTRDKLGQDLDSVATNLRIRQPYLQAIEEGRYQDLPGSTYAIGFVRAYAEFLGLDGNEIVRRFKQETGDFANRTELVFPSAASESGLPNAALLGLAVLIALLAYGVWYFYQSNETSIAEAVPALPDRLVNLLHRPVGKGADVTPVVPVDTAKPADGVAAAPAAPPSAAVSPVVPTPAPAASTTASLPPVNLPAANPPVAAPTMTAAAPQAGVAAGHEDVVPPSDEDTAPPSGPAASVASVPTPTPIETTKPSDPVLKPLDPKAKPTYDVVKPGDQAAAPGDVGRVILRADADCWIQIRDAVGAMVTSRLLRKGDSYAVPSRQGLTLTAGNAGALAILVDGKSTPSLGRIGMVRRDVSLDPERLSPANGAPND
jgi:cytoskeleton protein RodZ